MALKIKIRADQVVERADGSVKWISDSGSLNNNAEAEVDIVEGAAPATPEVPKKASAKKTAPPPKVTKSQPEPIPAKVSASKKPPKAADPAPSKPQAKTQEKNVAKAKAKSKTVGIRTIGGKEVDLSHYEKVKTAAGGTSLDVGDTTAKKLRGKTLDEVYTIVAKDTKQDVKALRAKYKHLNAGLQRMALGNMHRKGPREDKKAA